MADAIAVAEEIDWDPDRTLKPGMDYHDGTTYFTVPLMRNILIPAKKKGEDGHMEKQMRTYVVTSDRDGFWYDEEGLEPHSLVPDKKYIQEVDNRWSRTSVRGFLEKNLTGPSSKTLFDQIRSVYVRYVEFADESYFDIMTLYVMYTYCFRLFESTGYLHFNGTAASGKSRNLSLLNALAFNTIWASSMSAASLYRKLAGSPGTTCIDESESFDGERGEELHRILLAGYKRGSTVFRAEKDDQDRWIATSYDVFGPKALASINTLEPVIASRSLIVAMRPAIRELPDFLTENPQWTETRDHLYLWAMENTDAIATLASLWWDDATTGKKARLCPRLIGRQWETSSQFIILADYIGGEALASRLIDFFNRYFTAQQEAADALDRIRTTLRSIPRVLATKSPHPGFLYSTKDIYEVVASYMDTDATEFFKTKHVAKNLAVLGFRHTVRGSGGLRIRLAEDEVRREFAQRRVDPYDEDVDWLAGKVTYQAPTTLFETPEPAALKLRAKPFWETEEEA